MIAKQEEDQINPKINVFLYTERTIDSHGGSTISF